MDEAQVVAAADAAAQDEKKEDNDSSRHYDRLGLLDAGIAR